MQNLEQFDKQFETLVEFQNSTKTTFGWVDNTTKQLNRVYSGLKIQENDVVKYAILYPIDYESSKEISLNIISLLERELNNTYRIIEDETPSKNDLLKVYKIYKTTHGTEVDINRKLKLGAIYPKDILEPFGNCTVAEIKIVTYVDEEIGNIYKIMDGEDLLTNYNMTRLQRI